MSTEHPRQHQQLRRGIVLTVMLQDIGRCKDTLAVFDLPRRRTEDVQRACSIPKLVSLPTHPACIASQPSTSSYSRLPFNPSHHARILSDVSWTHVAERRWFAYRHSLLMPTRGAHSAVEVGDMVRLLVFGRYTAISRGIVPAPIYVSLVEPRITRQQAPE